MSPLLEKVPEPVEKIPRPPAAISEPTSASPTESPTTTGSGPFLFRWTRLPEEVAATAPESENGDPLGRFDLGGDDGEPYDASGPFAKSISALTALRREGQDDADWIEVARTLKSDAVRFRSTMSRHAALLLAISDALIFTEPADPTLDFQASTLNRGISLLAEPFVSEPDEEAFLTELLEHGWNLVPSAGSDPLSA